MRPIRLPARLGVMAVLVATTVATAACGPGHGAGAPTTVAPTTTAPVTKPPTTGVLTGIAYACAALRTVPIAHLTVFRNGVVVATSSVPNGTTYRFVLPPGKYDISNYSTEPGPLGHTVSVVAGHTTRVTVRNICE